MSKNITVRISDSETIGGDCPIVIIGPNGAGKTQHALKMASLNKIDLIPALRNIALQTDIPMQSVSQATEGLNRHLSSRRSRPWELGNEINELFAKLMAEDSSSAICFRDAYVEGHEIEPDQTNLMRLRDIWLRLFPGRHIDFAGHHPVVKSDYSVTTGEYPAQKMSDGERVALYLSGRVLDSTHKVVIVDEPEVHFHSRLGTRFWNEMEALRSDCRFIYVTHDLQFALSRKNATYVVIMPNEPPKIVPLNKNMPKELAESLLAAASFSIFAKRIIFCEGNEGSSLDQALYTAWFNSPDTAVVPVGNCTNVIQAVKAFGENNLITGGIAIGLIDRDYWSEIQLEKYSNSLHVLDVHEVENFFCLPRVFYAVAKHLGISSTEWKSKYKDVMDGVRKQFSEDLFKKQITERVKCRCEHEFRNALSQTGSIFDPVAFAQTLDPASWENSIEDIFKEEQKRLKEALQGSPEDINKHFPGKVFVKRFSDSIGLSFERYCDLVYKALNSSDKQYSEMAIDIEDALEGHLPSRKIEKGEII